MPNVESRFARALQAYFTTHSQAELAAAANLTRGALSNIANGYRRPTQDAARAVLEAAPLADCLPLLTAWLEDQIPARCSALVQIIPAETATATTETPNTATDEERALKWLHHQLATNVHAVHMVIDLWRAAGSPGAPAQHPPSTITKLEYSTDTTGPAARVAEDPPLTD